MDGTSSATWNSNFLGIFWSGDSIEPMLYPGEGIVIISAGPFEIVNAGAVSVDPINFSATAGQVEHYTGQTVLRIFQPQFLAALNQGLHISVYTNGGSLG